MVHPALSQRSLGPGDKLGTYELIRQIAVGGMAELYLGRTRGLEGFEKLVVLKRILPQYGTNERVAGMFLDDARLAATLRHPNIAQVYDVGQDTGAYFFSMEYVHGQDLGRLIDAAADAGVGVPLDCALTLVAGLCAGLNYAHTKAGPDGRPLDIVHRDVAPSNALVSYDGAVKLVDFGVARAGRVPSTRDGLTGTIAYRSPEQCRGDASVDKRSDLYSVGTILYELTTGRLPFTSASEYGILTQILNLDVPPPSRFVPNYPLALEAIVLRALARDPDQRYATTVELQADLEDFASANRLRISPLVLARLMSSLFPQRLEEWDHARAQGAFFVEQHVLRTLIESGKTPAAPVAPPAAPAVPSPRAASVSAPPVDTDNHQETSLVVLPARSQRPLVILGLAGVVGALLAVGFVATRESSPPVTPALDSRVAAPAPVPPPAPAPAPVAAELAPTPARVEPVAVEAAPAIVDVEPAAEPLVRPRGVAAARLVKQPLVKKRPVARQPARKRPKPEEKEPGWNADSPFLPVRPDKS